MSQFLQLPDGRFINMGLVFMIEDVPAGEVPKTHAYPAESEPKLLLFLTEGFDVSPGNPSRRGHHLTSKNREYILMWLDQFRGLD